MPSGIPRILQQAGAVCRLRGKLVTTFVFLMTVMTSHPLEFDLVLFDQRKRHCRLRITPASVAQGKKSENTVSSRGMYSHLDQGKKLRNGDILQIPTVHSEDLTPPNTIITGRLI